MTPRISVVVATYNRAETLRETLARLQAQDLPADAYEVIVVDDGSSDHTAGVAEAACRDSRVAMRYLHHANRGPGYTQNRGIREARAPVVLLIADDIFLEPGAVRAHLAAHERDPKAVLGVLGRVLQSPTLGGSVFLETWDPWHLGELPDGERLPYHMFWACNISFRRDFMLEHGMFRDERGRAGAAAHEDVELGYRLHRCGMQVVFDRNALGYHHHVETVEGTMRRSYQRGINWIDLRERVPHVEMDITYRAYDLATLARSWGELGGSRREHLLKSDRNRVKLAMRYFLRVALFNAITVRLLWMPFFGAAERFAWLGRLVREPMYRGVLVYHFRKGVRAGRRPGGGIPQAPVAQGG